MQSERDFKKSLKRFCFLFLGKKQVSIRLDLYIRSDLNCIRFKLCL